MTELSLNLHNEAATVELGQKVGTMLAQTGGVVFLTGTLGAGKTTFTRGVLARFGHSGAVKSPTYTLVEPYVFSGKAVYHFDLYRLADPEELEYMGIRDYFDEGALCIIEWPCRGEGFLPQPDIEIRLGPDGQGRRAEIVAGSLQGQAVIDSLSG